MTNDELGSATIALLRAIYNADGSKLHRADINYNDKILLQRLDILESQELIAPADDEFVCGDGSFGIVYNSYVITAKGIDYLDRSDQAAAEKANAEHRSEQQHRKESQRFWIQLLVTGFFSILSVALGAILQAKTDWMDWLTNLFP